MRKLIRRALASLRNRSLVENLKSAPRQIIYRIVYVVHPRREALFTHIYRHNKWGSSESVSGDGSTLEYTENLRKRLPQILGNYFVKTLLDTPCGDFRWMSLVVPSGDFRYIGGDIVKPLVEKNSCQYGNYRTSFVHLDLVKDPLPTADLMLCRDCLFHLSNDDIWSTLGHFVESEIPYLLTTTHINVSGFANTDIATGGFRLLDLFSPPFSFPEDPLERIDDWIYPHPPREMCLWSRGQVEQAYKRRE